MILDVAVENFPNILKSYGNHVSLEWLIPKCLEVLHDDSRFYDEVDLYNLSIKHISRQRNG